MLIEMLENYLTITFKLLAEMAPYLLFGFLFAGILNEFISIEKIARHLGRNSVISVIKAALLGIPLPLCSCGVIPPTMTLRKNGASRGAVLSFLIATPTTGVDSIFATYSLLGPFFAAYRVAASFFASIFTGMIANLFDHRHDKNESRQSNDPANNSTGLIKKIINVFHYAYFELFAEIGKWLALGILIGGLITFIIPDNFITTYLGKGWQAMLVMLVIGIPLYVCATGSIPIAAALLMKGINPGAAFVFLLTGPATNAVTVTVIYKYLGKKSTIVYLGTLIFSSIGLGLLLDYLWLRLGMQKHFIHHMSHSMLPAWLQIASAAVIIILVLVNFLLRTKTKTTAVTMKGNEMISSLTVPDITCNHCAMSIQKALIPIKGVENIDVNIHNKKVVIQHDKSVKAQQLMAAVKEAGYTPKLTEQD